jgi:hypothetical protein
MALEPATEVAKERIPTTATLLEAMLRLTQLGGQTLLVEEQGESLGQVSVSSIFRAAQAKSREPDTTPGDRAVDSVPAR